MKTRIFLVAAALMMFSALSFGQGFFILFDGCESQLSATCGGQDWYPDGTTIYIVQDLTNNGPSADDIIPSVGGEVGQVNFSQFLMNGVAVGCGNPGTFYTDPGFASSGNMPPNPHYYLAIYCPPNQRPTGDPTQGLHYHSNTFTPSPGPNPDFIPTWSCSPCGPPPCNPPQPPVVTIDAADGSDPQNIGVCIHLCDGGTTVVQVCVTSQHLVPQYPPIAEWHPGCMPPYCNDPNCTPGDAIVTGPVLNIHDPANPYDDCWEYVVHGTVDNTCICFNFDRFLAAGVESFTGVAGDNSVHLTWVTASETNVNHYAIVRDGVVIGNVASENSPTTHTYTYTDNAAHNGTTYTYGLRIVNADNTVTETGLTTTATPSFSAAVVTEYALLQNFPNPFNPTTDIAFDVLNTNPVTLKVYNAAGQLVSTLVNGATYNGGHRYVASFNSGNLPSGIYFYTVKIGSEFSATKKMLLLK